MKVKLANHDHDSFNTDYLIVGATHSLVNPGYVAGEGEGAAFEVQVEAIPLDTRWSPPLRTPKPMAGGPQTAIVVGPEDANGIHVDKFGRIRVKFYWDRRDKDGGGQPIKPDNRSCWIRVSQAWADAGFGTMMIPRIGQEVLVDFIDGDPDQPIVVGRVYNNDAMPPHKLPDHKTKSTWKSQTVGDTGQNYTETEEPPSAGEKGFNEIGFEDKAGEEQIFLHAQRDLVGWVRRDESWKVGHNQAVRIGWNRETQIKKHDTLTVETGDETHTVKAGSRKTTINKADELKVETGDKKLEVSMGNWANQVKMGNMTLKCDMGAVTIEAMQSIELKVGSASVKISQMGVDIKGMMITSKADMMNTTTGMMTEVKGSAMTTVKGAIVMIN
jgi:type VI secretion system secreted protein VgrG